MVTHDSLFIHLMGCQVNMGNKTKGVSHCGLAFNTKMYLKAKEESWKLKYFTIQKYNLPKIL